MTMGQRVAQKRKELGLSQETLGESLGVSRQAIYKWESDAAMPEIEKLVALSRLFSVSVGWLLGVEETETPVGEEATPGELTETQLKLVEEIVARYLAAQPLAKKAALGKWGVRLLFALCAILVCSLFTINGKVDELSRRNNDLQNAVNGVSNEVNRQIDSITNRVEAVLKSQNSLTADYGTELLSADLRAGTVTFSVYALPKTYTEGMSVLFSAENEAGELVQAAGTEGESQRFSTTLTCTLSDNISLSAVFVAGEKRQTQLLDTFYDLYSMSCPGVPLRDYFLNLHEVEDDGSILFRDAYVSIPQDVERASAAYAALEEAALRSVQVGLFRNQELVSWLEPCPEPDSFKGFENEDFYRLPDQTLQLSDSDTLCLAAVVTDEYGRRWVQPDGFYQIDRETATDRRLIPSQNNRTVTTDPNDWIV